MPMANESAFINNSMDEDSHLHEGAIIHQTPIKQNIPHFLKEINVYKVLCHTSCQASLKKDIKLVT